MVVLMEVGMAVLRCGVMWTNGVRDVLNSGTTVFIRSIEWEGGKGRKSE